MEASQEQTFEGFFRAQYLLKEDVDIFALIHEAIEVLKWEKPTEFSQKKDKLILSIILDVSNSGYESESSDISEQEKEEDFNVRSNMSKKYSRKEATITPHVLNSVVAQSTTTTSARRIIRIRIKEHNQIPNKDQETAEEGGQEENIVPNVKKIGQDKRKMHVSEDVFNKTKKSRTSENKNVDASFLKKSEDLKKYEEKFKIMVGKVVQEYSKIEQGRRKIQMIPIIPKSTGHVNMKLRKGNVNFKKQQPRYRNY